MATTDLAKLVVKLEAQTAQYVSELDKANKKLSKFTKDADVTLGGIGKTFLALGTAAAAGIALMVKNAIDGADNLNDLSKSTGVSVEQLSRLSFAAKQSGADLEDVTKGFKKLNQSLTEAAGKATSDSALAFKALGISVTDATGKIRSGDEVLLEVADKFRGFADGANKTTLAIALFGKAGEKLIPLLDEGASGIKAMGDRAEELGLVISGDAAKAADEFNDRLGEMKAQLVDGLGNQIAANVLPAFNELAKVWQEDTGRADALVAIAGVIGGALKALVTVGITVVSVFQQIGQAIYSINAAQVRLLQGDLRGALDEITSGFGNIGDNVSKDLSKIKAIWDAGPLNPKNADATVNAWNKINKGHGAIKGPAFEAPNLTALIEGQKKAEEAAKAHAAALKKQAEAVEAARQKLADFNVDLAEQVATFGLGEAAVTEYRVTVGDLADDVKKAGAAGGALRDAIIEQANALEKLKNAEAIAQVDIDIQNLTGHTKEAALAAFDLSNQLLKASLARQGDTKGLADLAKLRELTAAQADFNAERLKQQKILDDLANAEERIEHSQDVGAINELEALDQLSKARAEAAKQLQGVADAQANIAREAGNRELTRAAQESARAVAKLEEQTHLLEDRIKTTFEDAGADAFAEFLTGAKSAEDAVEGFIHTIEQEIANFVAKDLFRRLFGSLGSGTAGGAGGGSLIGSIAGFLGGLFGGSRDSGGPGQPGKVYRIGRGSEPDEYFMPASRGNFAIAGAGGGTTNNFNFSVSAPGGQVTRQTEQQIAAAAGRGVQMAQRRNG